MERETEGERLSKKWRERDVKEADRKAEIWQAREIRWDIESDRWGEKRGRKEREDVMEGEMVARDGWKETGR